MHIKVVAKELFTPVTEKHDLMKKIAIHIKHALISMRSMIFNCYNMYNQMQTMDLFGKYSLFFEQH